MPQVRCDQRLIYDDERDNGPTALRIASQETDCIANVRFCALTRVPQEFLHNLRILPIGIQECSERVAEGVIGNLLGNACPLESRFAVVAPSFS